MSGGGGKSHHHPYPYQPRPMPAQQLMWAAAAGPTPMYAPPPPMFDMAAASPLPVFHPNVSYLGRVCTVSGTPLTFGMWSPLHTMCFWVVVTGSANPSVLLLAVARCCCHLFLSL